MSAQTRACNWYNGITWLDRSSIKHGKITRKNIWDRQLDPDICFPTLMWHTWHVFFLLGGSVPKMSHGHRCWLVLIRRKHADIVLNGVSCAEIHVCREQGGSSCRRFAHGISFVFPRLGSRPVWWNWTLCCRRTSGSTNLLESEIGANHSEWLEVWNDVDFWLFVIN